MFNLNIYDVQGRLVKTQQNIANNKVVVNTEEMQNVVYLFTLSNR